MTPVPAARRDAAADGDRACCDGPVRRGATSLIARAVPAGSPLLVAVSGGSDSVALCALLARREADRLLVVHVHHGLRAAADRDAAFVADLARDLRLDCRVVRARDLHPGETPGETSSRRRRLAALVAVAREVGARHALLAHHLDDEAETVALRLLRGPATDRALAGIPVLRREGDLLLVRPVLRCADRRALRALRQTAGLACVQDETNADLGIARNRVRAWLAGEGPARRAELLALAARARGRLQRRRAAAVAALEDGLCAEGHGARLARAAWTPPDGPEAAAPFEYRAELLRLVAGALARPRRLDPRARQLAEIDRLIGNRGGRFRLPAVPAPIDGLVSRAGLHFPGEPLADDGPVRPLDVAGPATLPILSALLAEPVPA